MLLLPGLICYLVIAVGPSLATAYYAFTDATGIRGVPIQWIGFDNFHEFLFRGRASRDNLAALRRTLTFCIVVTTVQFLLGLLLAVLLNQRLPGRTIFRTLFFMPVILGVVVQGLMWKLFLLPRDGPMATMFGWFGTGVRVPRRPVGVHVGHGRADLGQRRHHDGDLPRRDAGDPAGALRRRVRSTAPARGSSSATSPGRS